MLADQLIWAVAQGRTERVALLLENGVDPNVAGSGHPTHEGRTAYEWAVSTPAAAGSPSCWPRPGPGRPDHRSMPSTSSWPPPLARTRTGPAGRTRRCGRPPSAAGPSAVEQAVDLRRPGAVRLLVEAGFSVDGAGRTTPLHLAAYNADLADGPPARQPGRRPAAGGSRYHSTPLGWAEHAGADEVADYLRALSADR